MNANGHRCDEDCFVPHDNMIGTNLAILAVSQCRWEEEIAAHKTEAAGKSDIDYAERLGTFIIVMASDKGHKKIAVAMSANSF
jgi:hypothetical protein